MTDVPPPVPVVTRSRRGGRTALTISLLVGIVLAGLVVLLSTRDPAGERVTQSPLLDKPAPATAGTTLDGGSIDIADLRGKWVFVNFFASWCTPCIVEHPELQAFDQAHAAADDAVLVSVTYDNDAREARAFFSEHGGSWPVIDDPENSIGVKYGVAQVPETFVIDPDGFVVARLAGGVTRDDLEAVLERFSRIDR